MSWEDTIEDDKPSAKSWEDTIEDDKPVAKAASTGESVGRGALQGASLGFADEGAGIIDALLSKTGTLFTGGAPNPYENQSLSETYSKGRDEERLKNSQASSANPGSYMLGNILGGAATAPLAPASLSGAAGIGAVAGLGSSEASDLSGMAQDTALGGALGAGAYGLAQGARSLGNSALKSATTATPAVSTAKMTAKAATGLPENLMPDNLSVKPDRPADWFFHTRKSREGLVDSANEVAKGMAERVAPVEVAAPAPIIEKMLPKIPKSDFALDVAKGTGVGHMVGSPWLGVPYAVSRTATSQGMAQKGLQVAAPALKAVDKAFQGGAKFAEESIAKAPEKYRAALQQAAASGGRSLAITHFMLSSRPDYQEAAVKPNGK